MRTLSLFLFCTATAVCLAFMSGCCDAPSSLSLLLPAQSESGHSSERTRYVEFVSSFPEALAESQEKGKPLLVFFTTPECMYCQQMLKETFSDEEVVELSTKFVCVRVDAGEAPELFEDYHVEAYPTVQFIAPNGTPLHRLMGKKEPETLVFQMHAALQGPDVHTAYRDGSSPY